MEIDDKIKNRNNWVKILFSGAILIVILYKLVSSDININIDKVQYSDILSLVISFFAIALSLAFYFKASDTSNKFYNDTYKFNKDISESIGRMDAGFNEKLRNLNENYSRFAEYGFLGMKNSNYEESIEEEEGKFKELLEEKERVITNLLNENEITAEARDTYRRQLDGMNEELNRQKKNIEDLKVNYTYNSEEISLISQLFNNSERRGMMNDIFSYYAKHPNNEYAIAQMEEDIRKELAPRFNTNLYRSMKKRKLVDDDGLLTDKTLRYIVNEYDI